MTTLNNDLNEKIVGLNYEMQKLNSENFQLRLKAENAEDLEKALISQSEEYDNVLKLHKQTMIQVENLQKYKDEIQKVFKEEFKKFDEVLLETNESEIWTSDQKPKIQVLWTIIATLKSVISM